MERVLSPGTETSQASDLSRSEIGYDPIRGPTSPEERELCEERERERRDREDRGWLGVVFRRVSSTNDTGKEDDD
jgi:hypothetical protein